MVAVVAKGFNYNDLTGKKLVFWKSGRLREVIDYYFSRYMQQLLVGSCYKYDVSARSSATAVSESCATAIIRPLHTVVL